MDKTVYDAIKAAMREGKSIDDILDDVDDAVDAIESENEDSAPHYAWIEKYKNVPENYVGICNSKTDRTINRTALVSALAIYFIQNGFPAELVFEEDEEEFRKFIGDVIDDGLESSIVAAEGAKELYEAEDTDDYVMAIGKLITKAFRHALDSQN